MMNNIPTLMQSEEKEAPWNQETKLIEVTVSQMLSSLVTIEVPNNFDITNEELLKEIVREQIYLPSEATLEHCQDCWYVDDFCVMI